MIVNYGTDPVILPGDALRRARSLTELRVLALLSERRDLLDGCPANAAKLAKALGVREEEVTSALDFFEGAGILARNEEGKRDPALLPPPDDAVTVLRGTELEETVKETPGIRTLIDILQAKIGKRFFNDGEVSKIAELVTNWKLDSDFILLLTDHLIRQGKGSVGYIFRAAVGLVQSGIDTYDALNRKYLTDEKTAPIRGKLRSLFGWGERKLSARENGYLKLWLEEWDLSYELLEYAYEVTVDGTGEFKIQYMAKVVAAWHEKGITDPAAAKADHENKPKPKAQGSTYGSFDTDDFISAALRRSYDEMKDGTGE